ncbi:hypothetical protein A3Q56_00664 [Intoshia linei]|uniref:Uncharacterized protein n=1 Tax=Intoshia linei TaxID=1819745 RepID=A0A177BDA8_9BILA|nr:hypothetical protein A3Q56_00664 [Intoshia linei]
MYLIFFDLLEHTLKLQEAYISFSRNVDEPDTGLDVKLINLIHTCCLQDAIVIKQSAYALLGYIIEFFDPIVKLLNTPKNRAASNAILLLSQLSQHMSQNFAEYVPMRMDMSYGDAVGFRSILWNNKVLTHENVTNQVTKFSNNQTNLELSTAMPHAISSIETGKMENKRTIYKRLNYQTNKTRTYFPT